MGHALDQTCQTRTLPAAALSPSDRVAVDFARGVLRANPIPSRAEWKPLEAAGIEPGAIRELAFLAALYVYYNRLALRSATSSIR
jgi:hypothetical protein